MAKLYPCEKCGTEVPIRSKGLCPMCRERQRREAGEQTFHSKPHTIKKFRKSTRNKRKTERECLPAYFDTLVKLLSKSPRCQNCGQYISYNYLPHHNIAHILAKSTHKSVMCNLDNHLFLCASKDRKDGGSCHDDFDNRGFDKVISMPVFPEALKRFEKIKPFVLEKTKIFHKFDAELDKTT